jgi:hypothetical protein
MDRAPVAGGVLHGLELSVCAEAVFRELGYPSPGQTPDVVRSSFRRIFSQGLRFFNPAIVYRTFPTEIDPTSSTWNGAPASQGDGDSLRGPSAIVYFTATVGELFDAHLRELNRRGEFLAAMIWDAIGTVATSELVSSLKKRLLDEYRALGWTRVTPVPASPAELPMVLKLAQAERLPVVVSDHSRLLSPSKSLAGYFHVGPEFSSR